jgi:hypothetical protein
MRNINEHNKFTWVTSLRANKGNVMLVTVAGLAKRTYI